MMVQPMGPATDGIWLPCGLNECFKLARYNQGCRFSPHIDGPWVPSDDVASIFTVLIYLNGPDSTSFPFKGGETNFLSPPCGVNSTSAETNNIDGGLIAKSQRHHSVISSVVPKTGSALIFEHNMLHEGAPIIEGVKYILRTEVLFRRVLSAIVPPISTADEDEESYNNIVQLYNRSEEQYDRHDATGFVESYLAALELQQQKVQPCIQFLLMSTHSHASHFTLF